MYSLGFSPHPMTTLLCCDSDTRNCSSDKEAFFGSKCYELSSVWDDMLERIPSVRPDDSRRAKVSWSTDELKFILSRRTKTPHCIVRPLERCTACNPPVFAPMPPLWCLKLLEMGTPCSSVATVTDAPFECPFANSRRTNAPRQGHRGVRTSLPVSRWKRCTMSEQVIRLTTLPPPRPSSLSSQTTLAFCGALGNHCSNAY